MVELEASMAIKVIRTKIEKFEQENLALAEKAADPLLNAGQFEVCIELSWLFLSRYLDIYKI